jgi:hypothetical protein
MYYLYPEIDICTSKGKGSMTRLPWFPGSSESATQKQVMTPEEIVLSSSGGFFSHSLQSDVLALYSINVVKGG